MSISTMVRINQATKDKLDKLSHPGQSYDGIIKELIAKAEPAIIAKRKRSRRRKNDREA